MAQLKDLLVTGASRFLNIIHGSIDGNAATADKVNHSLSITTPTGLVVAFDGSDDKTISLLAKDLQVANTMRFIGDTTSSFGIDNIDDRYCVETDSTGNNVIRISKLYNSSITPLTLTINGTSTSNVIIPQVGDVVRTNELELLCVGINESGISSGSTTYKKNSHWIVIGNNEMWHTF